MFKFIHSYFYCHEISISSFIVSHCCFWRVLSASLGVERECLWTEFKRANILEVFQREPERRGLCFPNVLMYSGSGEPEVVESLVKCLEKGMRYIPVNGTFCTWILKKKKALNEVVLSCIFLNIISIPYKDIKCWHNIIKSILVSDPSDKTLPQF